MEKTMRRFTLSNITAFTNFEPSMGGKWLELLKEVAPRLARAAAIFNPGETP
jgi:putative ABC transport system substrate-binding protein